MSAGMTLDDLAGHLTCTVPEAGQLLGIGRDAAYAAAARGEIPTLRLGRTIRVPVAKLLQILGVTHDMSEDGPADPSIATTKPVEGAFHHGDTNTPLRSA